MTTKENCPFCGSNRIGVHLKRSGAKSGFQACCLKCHVSQTGSYHPGADAALRAWNQRSQSSVKPLSNAIALSKALAEIETDLWPQNDTIDRAAKALIEQWHLICGLTNAVQPLLDMAKEVGLSGPLIDEAEAVAVKARQALA